MIRAVIFDLDGTLIDSRRDIAAACNHALQTEGFPARSLGEIESFVGDGAHALLHRAAELDASDPQVNLLVEVFLNYYTKHPLDHTTLMPGAESALDELSGYALAICTNKPRATTEAVLRGLGLRDRFSAINAGGDLPQKKPDPAPILHLLAELGVAATEAVMVGDGSQDILSGKRAGTFTVGVKGGIQDLQRLIDAAPDNLLESLSELPILLGSMGSNG